MDKMMIASLVVAVVVSLAAVFVLIYMATERGREHVFAFARRDRMGRRIAFVAAAVLYLPAMLSLMGLSWWWFQETDMTLGNPVATILWVFVRMLPGVIGMTGMLMGPILLSELSDARFLRAVCEAQALCREQEEGS